MADGLLYVPQGNKVTEHEHQHDEITELWRSVLEGGHKDAVSFLPCSPRCSMCRIPMGGMGGIVAKVIRGRSPSSKNPNMYNL